MTAEPLAGGRYAGARVPRVEDERLLTGRGLYVDDIRLPGMLHACFVRSPYARARIVSIDATEALALQGVRAVFVAADLNPHMHEQWHGVLGRTSPETPRPPLAEDEVRFVGDPVALVLADSRAIAEDAIDLVVIDYEPLTPVLDFAAAISSNELVHVDHGSNLIADMQGPPASAVDDIFESAAHVIADTIFQQSQSACPMETRGIVMSAAVPGEVTIWASTQAPHELRGFCARLLGIEEHRVRVIMRDTGGGFGQKVLVQRDEMAIMLCASRIGVPVKWIEDRRENLLAAGQSRHEQGDVRMAFDDSGHIEAVQIGYVENDGAYPTPWPLMPAAGVGGLFPGPYRVPKATFTIKTVYTNTVGRTAYRGPWVFESVARELMLDQAARKIGIDPVELRRRNLLRAEDMPFTTATGMVFNHVTPLENFEHALAQLDYDAFRAEQRAALARGRYIGIGTSNFIEPTTPSRGIYATEAATIRIEPSGKVNVYLAGGSAGNSLETTAVMLTADALGVDIADVSTIQGDTALTGYGAGTGGSRSGSMIAGAVAETATQLRDRIVAIAAHRLEASVDDIELAGGKAMVRGTPSGGVTMAEIAGFAYFQPDALPPGLPVGLEATGRYRAVMGNWANAAHICTCEVDIDTGQVRLLRYVVSENCGAMINPNIVEGQISGGVAQGIGGALLEHLAVDELGNPLATTLMEYLLPTAVDVPIIEFAHYDTPGPGPGGYKGVGEGGVLGAVPAVVNSVADALAPLGAHVNRLPLSPAAIVDLLAGVGR
jgi:carbon-monoxide dehydrogenase large subunit